MKEDTLMLCYMILMFAGLVWLFHCLISRYRPADKRKIASKKDTTRSFVLWTLLVHEREKKMSATRKLMEEDRKILDICKKISIVLTDEEYEILKNINKEETARAETLVNKYQRMED